jgi:hypothetical protein
MAAVGSAGAVTWGSGNTCSRKCDPVADRAISTLCGALLSSRGGGGGNEADRQRDWRDGGAAARNKANSVINACHQRNVRALDRSRGPNRCREPMALLRSRRDRLPAFHSTSVAFDSAYARSAGRLCFSLTSATLLTSAFSASMAACSSEANGLAGRKCFNSTTKASSIWPICLP